MMIDRDYLRLHSIECGDCWNWTASYSSSGIPMGPSGAERLPVRKLIAKHISKKAIPDGWVAATSCKNRECVNPDHLAIISRKKLLERSRANTNQALRAAKIALARRVGAKLNDEKVADIKTRQEPAATYAKRYGVHLAMIHKIWQGTAWAFATPAANPLAGLFTSLAVNDSSRKRA